MSGQYTYFAVFVKEVPVFHSGEYNGATMVITYHGGACFRIQFGDTILVCNPPSKKSSLKTSRFGADIALVTTDHIDMNGVSEIGIGDRQPFVIAGPGEYEVKDVFIRGYGAQTSYGGDVLPNTVYTIALEGMNLCFCGALDTVELPQAMRQAMEHVDILFVPVGEQGVLSPADAAKLAVSVEPALVLPVTLDQNPEKVLKAFLKEMGGNHGSPVDKLTIKKRDLEGKQGEVVILGSSAS